MTSAWSAWCLLLLLNSVKDFEVFLRYLKYLDIINICNKYFINISNNYFLLYLSWYIFCACVVCVLRGECWLVMQGSTWCSSVTITALLVTSRHQQPGHGGHGGHRHAARIITRILFSHTQTDHHQAHPQPGWWPQHCAGACCVVPRVGCRTTIANFVNPS